MTNYLLSNNNEFLFFFRIFRIYINSLKSRNRAIFVGKYYMARLEEFIIRIIKECLFEFISKIKIASQCIREIKSESLRIIKKLQNFGKSKLKVFVLVYRYYFTVYGTEIYRNKFPIIY